MEKGPDAFWTISEVADDLDLPQHVLRFWETRFTQIKPLKRGGGRRYYRPNDVELLKGIRHLLYGQGYTIRGVQRILKEDGLRFVQLIGRGEQSVADAPSGAHDPEIDIALPESVEEPFESSPERADRSPPFTTSLGQRGGGRPAASVVEAEDLAKRVEIPMSGRAASELSLDDLDRLRVALAELVECQRLLGALKPGSWEPGAEGEA